MGNEILLRPAVTDDAETLTALALRSKAYWGYDDAFLRACVDELTITPTRIAAENMTVAVAQDVIAGMISLAPSEADHVLELEDMFVDTPFIGTGLGAVLMAHAEKQARAQSALRIDVDADPNAQGFYERCGYRLVGSSPSASIPGRMLPRLSLPL
jgi:GNAT superfamily N-acetyltransferase